MGARQTCAAPRFAESDLRFNVSHCDDVAAYVFVFGREIGVDIEPSVGR